MTKSPKKRARPDGPSRMEESVGSSAKASCDFYGRCYSGECWRKTRACLCCGSLEHKVQTARTKLSTHQQFYR